MGRNVVNIDPDHYIVFGFDNMPMGGYYAEYWDKTSKVYKECEGYSDEVGFCPGVNKNRIIEFFEKHNCLEAVKKQQPKAFDKLILDLPC